MSFAPCTFWAADVGYPEVTLGTSSLPAITRQVIGYPTSAAQNVQGANDISTPVSVSRS